MSYAHRWESDRGDQMPGDEQVTIQVTCSVSTLEFDLRPNPRVAEGTLVSLWS